MVRAYDEAQGRYRKLSVEASKLFDELVPDKGAQN